MRGGNRFHQRHIELGTVEVTEVVHKLLSRAAKRRGMSVETLVARIASGAVTRGCIDQALGRYAEHLSDVRAGTVAAFDSDLDAEHGPEETARAAQV
jgi:hypothetical protein